MTLEELIQLTTVRKCPKCELIHALVRSCEDAKAYHDLASREKQGL